MTGKNRIMNGPKDDGTYVAEFRPPRATCWRTQSREPRHMWSGFPRADAPWLVRAEVNFGHEWAPPGGGAGPSRQVACAGGETTAPPQLNTRS
jgi:hypothetical protein